MIDRGLDLGKLAAVVLNAVILRDRMLFNMREHEWAPSSVH